MVVVVLPPQPSANPQMVCFAVGGASVCVASVCVRTPNTLETSVKDVLPASTPRNPPGTLLITIRLTTHTINSASFQK